MLLIEDKNEIADHGCGIPATDMHNLFRPFYRSEEARRIRPHGTGLGLSVQKSA